MKYGKMSQRLREKMDALLAAEKGTVYKYAGGRVNVALAYPNIYHVGMSNLGFQRIYSILNSREDVACERVFLPDEEDLDEYEKTGTALFTLETGKRVADFDILAFSVSFEQDYINILEILRLAGIPALRQERTEDHPLLLLGGICSFFNPEPLADFFDAVIVGEGEEAALEFIDAYKAAAERGKELLSALVKIEGIYIPGFYGLVYKDDGTIDHRVRLEPSAPERIKKRVFYGMEKKPAASVILTPNTEFADMHLLEVTRGCGRHCRFCMAGYIYLPPRNIASRTAVEAAKSADAACRKVGLVGAALSDYPYIEELCAAVEGSISVSSLRADTLSGKLIQRLAESGHKTVSIAPEAGSERLRKVINKGILEEDILRAAEMVFSSGIPNLKLYFIIGLPTETDEDLEAISSLAKKVHDIQLRHARKAGRIGRITLSVNSFVPKPFTPFQWEPMEGVENLNRKLRILKKSVSKIGNTNLIHDLPKWEYIQALLSRGDRRIGALIKKAHERAGDWKSAARDLGIDMDFYVTRRRPLDEVLPWDFIDIGVRKDYLMNEYQRALEGRYTPPCKVGACRTCGVCGDAESDSGILRSEL